MRIKFICFSCWGIRRWKDIKLFLSCQSFIFTHLSMLVSSITPWHPDQKARSTKFIGWHLIESNFDFGKYERMNAWNIYHRFLWFIPAPASAFSRKFYPYQIKPFIQIWFGILHHFFMYRIHELHFKAFAIPLHMIVFALRANKSFYLS